jgi:hypothetical protein
LLTDFGVVSGDRGDELNLLLVLDGLSAGPA